MKNIFFISILIFAIPLLVLSQEPEPNTVEFKYDDAGNRILRHAIYVPEIGKVKTLEGDSLGHHNLTKSFPADSIVINDISVSIYPNPTLGKFKVSMNNISEKDDIQYILLSLTGQVVSNNVIHLNETEVDMQKCVSGPYIFRLIVNGESTSWRIIKR